MSFYICLKLAYFIFYSSHLYQLVLADFHYMQKPKDQTLKISDIVIKSSKQALQFRRQKPTQPVQLLGLQSPPPGHLSQAQVPSLTHQAKQDLSKIHIQVPSTQQVLTKWEVIINLNFSFNKYPPLLSSLPQIFRFSSLRQLSFYILQEVSFTSRQKTVPFRPIISKCNWLSIFHLLNTPQSYICYMVFI